MYFGIIIIIIIYTGTNVYYACVYDFVKSFYGLWTKRDEKKKNF